MAAIAAVVGLGGGVALVIGAPVASASTTIGFTGGNPPFLSAISCTPDFAAQTATAAGEPSYSVPAGINEITAWST